MPELATPVVQPGTLRRRQQPTLTAGSLLLRPWQPRDAPAVEAAYQDPAIQRWHVRSLTGSEAADLIDTWRERWATETSAEWAVESTDGFLGRVALRHLDLSRGTGEVAYWVTPQARGQSVASRALTAVSHWAFALGLHRLELEHSTLNEASCRVATRAGFALEGTKRLAGLHTDGWHDMHVHAQISPPEDDPR